MAWQQIIDTDGNGATPEPYTDSQGHTTSMTVTSDIALNYFTGAGPLQNNWIIGDNSATVSEAHTHTFSTPVHALRIDIHYLDAGDAANFAYRDESGTVHSINLQQWIASGDAVVTLGTGHSLATGVPGGPTLSHIRGSLPNDEQQGGTTTVELYFPNAATDVFVGKNTTSTTGESDAYGYRLYYDDVTSVVCFCRNTLIETQTGPNQVEALRVGDMVRTKDNGFQPIRWIGSRKLSAQELDASPDLRPIRILAGALGASTPDSDLTVSPQHRVLIRSKIAQRMFGTDEVLVAAKNLLEIDGIDVVDEGAEVEYFHILFDRHEVIFSNGAESESLYTGPEALKSVGTAAQEEIFAVFPELRNQNPSYIPEGARMLLSGRHGRKLAQRHLKNHKTLIS